MAGLAEAAAATAATPPPSHPRARDTTRQGDSPPEAARKKAWVGTDDDVRDVGAIAAVTSVSEEPSADWQQLDERHEVYDELELPAGVKPLSGRWVETNNYEKA
jgi:hypothetical protein